MKKLKRTPEQIADLLKTWDYRTLIEHRAETITRLHEYNKEEQEEYKTTILRQKETIRLINNELNNRI